MLVRSKEKQLCKLAVASAHNALKNVNFQNLHIIGQDSSSASRGDKSIVRSLSCHRNHTSRRTKLQILALLQYNFLNQEHAPISSIYRQKVGAQRKRYCIIELQKIRIVTVQRCRAVTKVFREMSLLKKSGSVRSYYKRIITLGST